MSTEPRAFDLNPLVDAIAEAVTARVASQLGVRDRRKAVPRAEAAELLGMSIDSFEKYVQDEVRVIRRGKHRLVLLADLERWVDENAALTVGAK